MNKNDLVAKVASSTGLSKTDSANVVDGVFNAITGSLSGGKRFAWLVSAPSASPDATRPRAAIPGLEKKLRSRHPISPSSRLARDSSRRSTDREPFEVKCRCRLRSKTQPALLLTDIPHIPSKFVEIAPLSHRQGNCIPYAAIRWHDFGNRPALGRPLGHFSRHPDTPLLSLSPRRRFPRPTPERVFVADHQSSSGFSGTGPSAPPPQPIGT